MHTYRDVVNHSIGKKNKHHPTIEFTAGITVSEANFLDTTIYKGEKFNRESVLNIRIHFKLTEIFQYTLYSTCHPPGANAKKRFAKGEALLLLRTSKQKFVRNTTG